MTLDLTPRPPVDVDQWRQDIEKKIARAHYFEALDRAAYLASLRPTKAPKIQRTPTATSTTPRTPGVRKPRKPRAIQPPTLRPCPVCGCPTRSNSVKAADAPGTKPRRAGGLCTTCAPARPGRPGKERAPRVTVEEAAAWVVAYEAGQTIVGIARSVNRSAVTVHMHLVRAGVQTKRANQHTGGSVS